MRALAAISASVVFVGYAFAAGCIGSRTSADAPFANDETEDDGAARDDDGAGAQDPSGPGGAGGFPSNVGPGPTGPGGSVGEGGGFGVGGFGTGGAFGGMGGTTVVGVGGAGGGGTTFPSIDCVSETCTGGDICCHDIDNPTNSGCAPPGTCMGPAIEVSCQQPSDCSGGEVCCGVFDFVGMMQGYEVVQCDATCDPPQFDLAGIVMCGAEPSVCDNGPSSCVDSSSLPDGFNYCDPN